MYQHHHHHHHHHHQQQQHQQHDSCNMKQQVSMLFSMVLVPALPRIHSVPVAISGASWEVDVLHTPAGQYMQRSGGFRV